MRCVAGLCRLTAVPAVAAGAVVLHAPCWAAGQAVAAEDRSAARAPARGGRRPGIGPGPPSSPARPGVPALRSLCALARAPGGGRPACLSTPMPRSCAPARDWPSMRHAADPGRGGDRLRRAGRGAARLLRRSGRRGPGRAASSRPRRCSPPAGPARRRSCCARAWIRDDFGPDEESLFLERFGTAADARRPLGPPRPAALGPAPRSGPAHAAARAPAASGPVAAARLKLQLSDPGVEAALAALPAAARADAGVHVRPAALAHGARQRGRRARDPAGPARGAGSTRAVVARAGEGDPRGARRARVQARLPARQQQSADHRGAACRRRVAGGLAGAAVHRTSPRQHGGISSGCGRRCSTPISRGRARLLVRPGSGGWGRRPPPPRPGTTAPPPIPAPSMASLRPIELGHDPGRRVPSPRTPTAAGAGAALERRLPAQLAWLLCRQGQARYAQPFFRHLGYEAADNADRARRGRGTGGRLRPCRARSGGHPRRCGQRRLLAARILPTAARAARSDRTATAWRSRPSCWRWRARRACSIPRRAAGPVRWV